MVNLLQLLKCACSTLIISQFKTSIAIQEAIVAVNKYFIADQFHNFG